eukprot:791006_1
MEYCEGGDLSSRIQRVKKPFPEEVILDWLVQIALALRSCHRLKILHRDLKTQNIFLTEDDYVKIGDFGIARVLTGTMDMAQTVVGTPYSMSPEVCQNKPYSFKSDMWSLGCVLYEVASRQNAFGGANLLAVVLKIVQEPHERLPECYSREFSKLVDDLLHKDPAKRLSIDDLLNRPLLTDRIARVKHEQSTRARQLKKKRTLARLNRKVRPPTMDHLSAERDRENGGNASGQPNKFFRRRRSSAPAVGPFDQFAVPVSPEHSPADHVVTEGARNSYDPSELYAALQRRRRGSVSTGARRRRASVAEGARTSYFSLAEPAQQSPRLRSRMAYSLSDVGGARSSRLTPRTRTDELEMRRVHAARRQQIIDLSVIERDLVKSHRCSSDCSSSHVRTSLRSEEMFETSLPPAFYPNTASSEASPMSDGSHARSSVHSRADADIMRVSSLSLSSSSSARSLALSHARAALMSPTEGRKSSPRFTRAPPNLNRSGHSSASDDTDYEDDPFEEYESDGEGDRRREGRAGPGPTHYPRAMHNARTRRSASVDWGSFH